MSAIPVTTKRTNQQYAGFQLPAHDVDVVALVIQRSCLRSHHLQIGVHATLVTIHEEL